VRFWYLLKLRKDIPAGGEKNGHDFATENLTLDSGNPVIDKMPLGRYFLIF